MTIVELPILFAQVSARGAITLESSVFARKGGTRVYRRMPSKATWMQTYRDINGSEYTAAGLEEFHRAVHDGVASGASHLFTTVSLEKPSVNVAHSLGLLVHVKSGRIELFESRGSNLGDKRHTGIRRNYYTQASFNKVHAQIVHMFFRKNPIMKEANLEARMAGRTIPFRTDRFKPLKMLQRPVLLTHDNVCRVGVLVYLFHRMHTPKASRYSVYDKVKRSGCAA